MNKNTWGLQFVEVDVVNNEFKQLLGLNIGNEITTRNLFNQIKNEFEENNAEPDCIIDLLDNEDSIVDDFAVTKKQAIDIASRLGHQIE